MKTYEIVVIYSLQMSGEIPQQGKTLLEGIVQKHEGKVLNMVDLGKRALGYSIKKAKEGYCLLFDCELNPARVDSVKHALRLTAEVLKFTIVVKTAPKVKRERIKRKRRQRPAAHTAQAGVSAKG